MDDKKQELYNISWKQDYSLVTLSLDELIVEMQLGDSEYVEAKQVIADIKSKL